MGSDRMMPPPAPPRREEGGKGAGKALRKDAQGRYTTDRQGVQICFPFGVGKCKGVCAQGRSHVCQICLGSHPYTNCPKKGRSPDN